MIFDSYLTTIVHENFDGALRAFGIKFKESNKTQRNIIFYFLRKDLLVVVTYNYTNHFIDIDLSHETDFSKLIGSESISLRHIMKDKKFDYSYLQDYDAVMPSQIPIENSLKILSEYLLKYGRSYLDGSEWKTNRDIPL
jgi:hypothetical protein